MPDSVITINAAHDGWITNLIGNFERELNGIIGSAQARTLAILREQLTVKDGKIVRSIANTKTLRKFDDIFLAEMNRAGYQHLLNEFTAQLPGQLPFFQETMERLSAAMKTPLPKIQFSPSDLKVFADQGLSAKDGLDAVVESIAAQAKNRILLSTGGLAFADLAGSLATYLHKALPEATGLAETATSTYYRIIADRGYQIIQQDLPSLELKYRYYGPLDKLTRPFCAHLEQVNKTYTRAEIDEMDNGQIPNVFISCGGWRCRHQWLIALDEPEAKPVVVPPVVVTPPVPVPVPPPAPKPATFGKVHYDSIDSDLSKSKTEEVLSALNDSPALDIFKAFPIRKITLTRTLQQDRAAGPPVGTYTFWSNQIEINTARGPDSYGKPFEPGKTWTFSSTGFDKVEAMRRTLIHETGHHLQAIGGADVVKIAVAALLSADRKPVTGYAATAAGEYLAETWAAYHVEKEKLEAFDPVGVTMINDILRTIRKKLGI